MRDSGEPRSVSRENSKINGGKIMPIKWPARPNGYPSNTLPQSQESIIGVNVGIPLPVSEKPEPFSIAEAPSATVSEERREELRKNGAGIAAKKLGLLDEGGIVDSVAALKPMERPIMLASYAGSIVDGSVSEGVGPVERQKDIRHIMSQVIDLADMLQEPEKQNPPAA